MMGQGGGAPVCACMYVCICCVCMYVFGNLPFPICTKRNDKVNTFSYLTFIVLHNVST